MRLLPVVIIFAAFMLAVVAFSSTPALILPVALLWMIFGIGLLWWIERQAERKRQREADPNRCFFCGYDCRATPNRCPECGASPPTTMPPDFFDGR